MQYVELVQVEQFAILILHKMHFKFVVFEESVYESIEQPLIQSELSYLRYLLVLFEMHC